MRAALQGIEKGYPSYLAEKALKDAERERDRAARGAGGGGGAGDDDRSEGVLLRSVFD